ncbi:MAG: CpsB/CapC family capsule biosynthesis tyrosine phosphatase [Acidobacteriota bacterium]
MIDLHSHLLPGIDDGAASLEEALEMCRMAAEDGCTALIATPHLRHEYWLNDDRDALEALWREVREAAADYLEVFLGGEIAINSDSASELDQLPNGSLLPLAGSRYLLLELNPPGFGPDPLDLIHELSVGGWYPVIAHPERFRWLAGDRRFLHDLIDHGALMQITAMSVTGEAARWVRDCAFQLLDDGAVHFIASDCHNTRIRPPGLSRAYRQIASTRGEAVARELMVENPRAVLENRPIGRAAERPISTGGPKRIDAPSASSSRPW